MELNPNVKINSACLVQPIEDVDRKVVVFEGLSGRERFALEIGIIIG